MKAIRRILRFIRRENLDRLFLIVVLLMVFSTIGLVLVEPGVDWRNALWWSIVTLTTVGYGDITPTTLGGRLIGIVIMIFGIGILGMLTATIASVFVERKLREHRGMSSYNFEGHLILCQWNHRAKEILAELRSDPRMETAPIVLIARVDEKPLEDDNLYFIQGDVTEENLIRANIQKANTVVILGDDRLEATTRDAQVVLATLTVESLNPAVYTIVELVDESNVRHCQRAHADEIIVGDEFSSRLISRAALNHGISKVLSELLSSRFGNDLFKIPVPAALQGRPFLEVFTEMKRNANSIVLAVQKNGEGEVIANPENDLPVEPGDHLIVISLGQPSL